MKRSGALEYLSLIFSLSAALIVNFQAGARMALVFLSILLLTLGSMDVGSSPCESNCYSKKDCKGIEYDIHEAVCCEGNLHPGAGLACCGKQSYNPAEAACCTEKHGNELTAKVTPGLSQRVSSSCGLTAYDSLNEMCCESTIVPRPAERAGCCVRDAFDKDTHLCCGNEIQRKLSDYHRCCEPHLFDNKTQCCCDVDGALKIKPIGSKCCEESALGVHPQNHGPKNLSTNPHISHQMEPLESPLCSTSGRPDVVPTVCHPHAHVCCRPGRRPSYDQLYGGTMAILGRGRVLCCDQILHEDREVGNERQGSGAHHHLATGTVCCSRFHGSPGEHCCGTELYQPHREICCSGHRYPKVGNVHCCGVKAYSVKNRQMKCCAGRLHILPDRSAREAQCCGSTLKKPSDVCCTSEDEEVLFSPKPGFRCCGHHYFNTSLRSCCEGRLSPIHKPRHHHSNLIKESRLVSLNNLDEDDLCGEMHAGIVDSVSLHSVVFSSVVKLHGRNATMKHLPSTYILTKPDHCNFPKLIPGKSYFFTEVNVPIDFNHDSILQSLHFIFSTCFPSQASSD